MDASLEEKLKALQKSMASLQQVTRDQTTVSRDPLGVVLAPQPSLPSQIAERHQLLRRLTPVISAFTGIELSQQHEEKLYRCCCQLCPPDQLPGLVSALEIQGRAHPQFSALIELLTVHETYFYRDPLQLEGVKRDILLPLIAARMSSSMPIIRIWSAACSSGEEVYSLLFMVVDALVEQGQAIVTAEGVKTRWHIEILGTDLSTAILEKAQQGRYCDGILGAFRTMPTAWNRYFDSETVHNGEKSRSVRGYLRKFVLFKSFNLKLKTPPVMGVDLVFCRNVLIYFDTGTKESVQRMLHSALVSGGWLVLGSTDTNLVPSLLSRVQKKDCTLFRAH